MLDTKGCERKGKGTRAHVVLKHAIKRINDLPISTPEAYGKYETEMKRLNVEKQAELIVESKGMQMQLNQLVSKIEERKQGMLDEKDKELKAYYKTDLKALSKRKRELADVLSEKKEEIERTKQVALTHKEFIELWQKVPKILTETDDMFVLDTLLRKVFLNFFVYAKSVECSTLSAPFDSIEELSVLNCGVKRTNIELFQIIQSQPEEFHRIKSSFTQFEATSPPNRPSESLIVRY